MRPLETERLKLRLIRATDAEHIYRTWASDPEVTRYLTWQTHESPEDTRKIVDLWVSEYEKEGTYRWGIERKSDGVLMGMIDAVGFRNGVPAIGYCLGRAFWNNGYMTEALKAVISELFTEGYDAVFIEAVVENIGSNRVIEKAGFIFTGTRPAEIFPGKPWIREINTYEIHR
jgi:ribosomal-protein-alanine N-acetyltransferase